MNTKLKNNLTKMAAMTLIVLMSIFSIQTVSVFADGETETYTVDASDFNEQIKKMLYPSADCDTRDYKIRYISFVDEPFTSEVNLAKEGELPIYARMITGGTRTITFTSEYKLDYSEVKEYIITRTDVDPDRQNTPDTDDDITTTFTFKVADNKTECIYEKRTLSTDTVVSYYLKDNDSRNNKISPVIVEEEFNGTTTTVLQTITITNDKGPVTLPELNISDDLCGIELYTEADKVYLTTDNCEAMFAEFSGAYEIDLSKCYVSSTVTNCSGMFFGCRKVKTLDLSHFDTSGCVDMSEMFCYCQNVKNLDVSLLNTSSCENFESMFYRCSADILDVSSFDMSHAIDISWMFTYTTGSLVGVEGWNTSNLQILTGVFCNCNMTSFDLRGWDVSHVESFSRMFGNCYKLQTVNCAGWDTGECISLDYMFANAFRLKTLDMSGWDTSKVTDITAMFAFAARDDGTNSSLVIDMSGWDLRALTSASNVFTKCYCTTIYGPDYLNSLNIQLPFVKVNQSGTSTTSWSVFLDEKYLSRGLVSMIQYQIYFGVNVLLATDMSYSDEDYSTNYIETRGIDSYYEHYHTQYTETPLTVALTLYLEPACKISKQSTCMFEVIGKLQTLINIYYKRNYMYYPISDMAVLAGFLNTYIPLTVDDEEHEFLCPSRYGYITRTRSNIMSMFDSTAFIDYTGALPEYAHFDTSALYHYTEDDWIALGDACTDMITYMESKKQSIGYVLDIPDECPLTKDTDGYWTNDISIPLCTLRSLDLVEDDDYITFAINEHSTMYAVADCVLTGEYSIGAKIFLGESHVSSYFLPSVYETPVQAQAKLTLTSVTGSIPIYGRILAYTGAGSSDEDYVFPLPPGVSSGTFDFSYTIDRRVDKILAGLLP